MSVNAWWTADPAEIYFLETTDRADIGVNLQAPQEDAAGHAHHGYALLRFVRHGDVVFHYEQPIGIVAWSRAVGAPYRDSMVWGARGRTAQKAHVQPYERPAWKVALEGPYLLPEPVSLDELRSHEDEIRRATAEVESAIVGSSYRPFQLGPKQSLRPTQHYLTKLPVGVILAVPALLAAADDAGNEASPVLASPATAMTAPPPSLGQTYVLADESASGTDRDPFEVDPAAVDRGVQGHARTQNALANWVSSQGHEPRSPSPLEPQYDIAWEADGQLFVAEVKSLTTANEERQLRLGLGQVLRYRHVMMRTHADVRPVLAVERAPTDESWQDLCRSVEVTLFWPGRFQALASRSQDRQT